MGTKALSHILKYWQTNINVKMFISTWWVGKKLQSSFKMWLCNPHACKWSCSIFLIYLQYAEHKADHPYEKKKLSIFDDRKPSSFLPPVHHQWGTWDLGYGGGSCRRPAPTCLLSLSGISLMAIRTWLLRSLPAYTTPYVPFPSTTRSPFSSWSYSYYRRKSNEIKKPTHCPEILKKFTNNIIWVAGRLYFLSIFH